MGADLEQAPCRVHDRIANQRRFQSARFGQHERATVAVRFQGHRQRAANRPEIPGQSELAGKFVVFQRVRRDLSGGGEDP